MNVRDWLHVSDHCRGVEQVLVRGVAGQTYNLGGNCERPNIDLVRMLCEVIDRLFSQRPELRARFLACPAARGARCETLIEFVRDRPGHDRRYAVDTTKAAGELDFLPLTSLESGLAATVGWYVDHEWWWTAVLSGRYRQWQGIAQLAEIEQAAVAS